MLFPVIELRDGRITRITKNDLVAGSEYGDDAVGVAKSFQAAGAPWVHVVDLDAARSGKSRNRVVVAAIASEIDIPVQATGGVRDLGSAESLLDLGVQRVVLDRVAANEPGLVEQLSLRHPQRIALELDAHEPNETRQLVERYSVSDLAAFVVSGLDTDTGLATMLEVMRDTPIDVLAAADVESLADVQALAQLNIGGRRVAGVVVTKAIYEKKFTITDAVVACSVP